MSAETLMPRVSAVLEAHSMSVSLIMMLTLRVFEVEVADVLHLTYTQTNYAGTLCKAMSHVQSTVRRQAGYDPYVHSLGCRAPQRVARQFP